MKIWSLSKAEEEAIRFFQAADAQNKTVCQWTQNYFILFDKKPCWSCMRKACQKKHGLPANMWFDYSQMPFVSFICSLTNGHLWPVRNKS